MAKKFGLPHGARCVSALEQETKYEIPLHDCADGDRNLASGADYSSGRGSQLPSGFDDVRPMAPIGEACRERGRESREQRWFYRGKRVLLLCVGKTNVPLGDIGIGRVTHL